MTMEPFAKTAALVQQGLEQGAYPSACLSVGIGPRVLCRRTFGHVTGHTLYDMASVSKILGATMIALRWLEEGKLRLYDRVGAFLDAPADKADITILQLMTHTSGIPDHFLLQEECGSPEEVTQAILRHPLVQRPGGVPIYSCMGYILLGKILERIGDNLYLAAYNGVRCTAIFNIFVGRYFVDDVYGVQRAKQWGK